MMKITLYSLIAGLRPAGLILRDGSRSCLFCQCWPDVDTALRGRRFHRLKQTAVFTSRFKMRPATGPESLSRKCPRNRVG
jgi:hypothetical protein